MIGKASAPGKAPPDFVIVGAPKCGTTSVHSTMLRHPQLYFSRGIKEPHYFSFDYPLRREVETLRDYDRLFEGAQVSQLRGEASVYYLSSEQAISGILKRRPDAKLIAIVRNPIDMFVSLHNENLNALDEDEVDPQRAWFLQEQRAQGIAVPKLCKEPAFLQYKKLCLLGYQVQRMFQQVPKSQRLVLVFDDIENNPRAVYRQIVEFLGVADDGKNKFVHENMYARHRFRLVAQSIRLILVSTFVRRMRLKLKPYLNAIWIRPVVWAARFSLRRVPKPPLSPAFREELTKAFEEDIETLESLLNRDLSNWRAAPPAKAAKA